MKTMMTGLVAFLTLGAFTYEGYGAIQYWDPDSATGYQHGNGFWGTNETETKWGVLATGPRSMWTNGNEAFFSATGGSSRIELVTPILGKSFRIDGSAYTLVITNGAVAVFTNNAASYIGYNSSSNTLVIAGGSGITTRLEQVTALSTIEIGYPGRLQNAIQVDGAGYPGSAQLASSNFNIKGVSTRYSILRGGRHEGKGSLSLYGTNNQFVISGLSGAESFVTNGGLITVGVGAGDNSNGITLGPWGRMFAPGGMTIGVSSIGNWVTVDNASFAVGGTLTVGGSGGASSRLVVTNGGVMISAPSTTALSLSGTFSGSTASLLVTGEGSLWDAGSGILILGSSSGADNSLTVENGGVITNAGAVRIPYYGQQYIASPGRGNALVVQSGGKYFGSGNILLASAVAAINNRLLVAGAGSVLNAGGGSLYAGGYSFTTNSTVRIENGGRMTNVAAVSIGGSVGTTQSGHSLTIASGGALFSTAASAFGNGAGNNDCTVRVSGAGSVWNLANGGLAVGVVGSTNNSLTIDQGGLMDAAGLVTVLGASNTVNLLGGTLNATALTVNNGLPFTAGDGDQPAVLTLSGGSPSLFYNGLTINSNATLLAAGNLSGGASGVAVRASAVFSPALSGVGLFQIDGSNFVWNTGAVYRCQVTDLASGPTLGWDLINVSSQAVFGASGLVVKMDSMSAPAANFDPTRDYNLRILNYGSQSGFDPAAFSVDISSFDNGGSWSVTNGNNALWLVYRGAPAAPAATYTWKVPNSGLWSDPANWTNNAAPTAGGNPSWILEFGSGATSYYASNNLPGFFQLNQLRLSSAAGLTNAITGGRLAFTNDGAKIEYRESGTGAFIVSNVVRLITDTEFGGNALGGQLTFMGGMTNLGTLTKRGAWTLALGSANNYFVGPVVVDGQDGRLHVALQTAFAGVGSVIVSNGSLTTLDTTQTMTMSGTATGRYGLVRGAGSTWSNSTYLVLYNKATNSLFVVDGGLLWIKKLTSLFAGGSQDGKLVVTNGGRFYNGSGVVVMSDSSTNCHLIITGPTSTSYFDNAVIVSAGGQSNSLAVENGAILNGGNNFGLSVGGWKNTLRVSGGSRVYLNSISTGFSVKGTNNSATVTGTGSAVLNTANIARSSLGVGGDYGNEMTITDNGVVSNITLQVAISSHSNSLVVTNGGKLFLYAGDSFIASNGVANEVKVSGASQLTGSGRILVVCDATGTLNRLTVEAGGVITNLGTLLLASGPSSSNNTVTADGGYLQCRVLTTSNDLPNRFIMTGAAQVSPGFLYVTNAQFDLAFRGGVLNVRTALVSNGSAFVAGDGAQAATLMMAPASRGDFVDGLVVTSQAVLAGSGLVAASSTVYGVLSPGDGVGGLTNSGALILTSGAESKIELAAYTAPGQGWDYLTVTNGPLRLDGGLSVLLTGGFTPTNSQSFLIMTNLGADTVSGTFANLAGGMVSARTNAGDRAVGLFQVRIGPQGVTLDGYTPIRVNPGTILVIR